VDVDGCHSTLCGSDDSQLAPWAQVTRREDPRNAGFLTLIDPDEASGFVNPATCPFRQSAFTFRTQVKEKGIAFNGCIGKYDVRDSMR
jgi:hypothetical protein